MLNPVAPDDPRANKEPETKELSKAKLYNLVSSTYLLPDKDSRAVSRSYMLKVRNNQVFRMPRHDLLEFEARLELDHHLKKGYHNITILIERLSTLILQLNIRPLGFNPGSYPDESWVYRAIRFLDRSNLLEVYRLPVPGYQDPPCMASRM